MLLWPSCPRLLSFLVSELLFLFSPLPKSFLLIYSTPPPPRASATLVSSSKWIRNNQVFWLPSRCTVAPMLFGTHTDRRPSLRAFGACLAAVAAPICRVYYKSATFCLWFHFPMTSIYVDLRFFAPHSSYWTFHVLIRSFQFVAFFLFSSFCSVFSFHSISLFFIFFSFGLCRCLLIFSARLLGTVHGLRPFALIRRVLWWLTKGIKTDRQTKRWNRTDSKSQMMMAVKIILQRKFGRCCPVRTGVANLLWPKYLVLSSSDFI